ncbi:MAG: hypothetical protein NC419_08040 [Muribaculaceae bacterium]|nr:hypothetical protein [Muribaculaceae bacterium]
MKKRVFLLCAGSVLVLGVVIAGITAGMAGSNEEGIAQESIELRADSRSTDPDKDALYADYIVKTVVSGIEDCDGVVDCAIDIDYADGEILSADVGIVAGQDRADTLETDILDYVSKSFDIPAENVTLSFQEE